MLVTPTNLFRDAQKKHYAIPAANFFDLNSLKSHLEVANKLKKPIIVALAESHLGRHIQLEEAAILGKYYAEKSSVPVVLHLDHGQKIETVRKAIHLGFSSVMIDRSMAPIEENIRITKEIVQYAHANNVSVEAEIGHVGSNDNIDDDNQYTSVKEAKQFIDAANCDSLAVSIGTAHGFYKGTPKINFNRLHELASSVHTPLVLHGGSSSGDDNLHRCATEGIAKINIFSDFLKGAFSQIDAAHPKTFLDILDAAKDGVQKTLEHYYRVFNTPSI